MIFFAKYKTRKDLIKLCLRVLLFLAILLKAPIILTYSAKIIILRYFFKLFQRRLFDKLMLSYEKCAWSWNKIREWLGMERDSFNSVGRLYRLSYRHSCFHPDFVLFTAIVAKQTFNKGLCNLKYTKRVVRICSYSQNK